MKNININLFKVIVGISFLLLFSCTNELNTAPDTGSSQSAEEIFKDPAAYKQFLAKLYAGLATTGQTGPSGSGDVAGIDEGFSQYIRNYWNLQELTTDEAIIGWNDATIKDFHYQTWTSSDGFIEATFARLAFQVTNCNEFLRQTTDSKLDARGVSETLREEIKNYRAEARFLRALSYWHIVDLFGGASLETEDASSSYHKPEYASRAQLFQFVETELTAINADLKDPNTNEQYRADKAAAWMLKAKLLLNAKVYVGTDRFADALTEINKVITQSSYQLSTNYKDLFLADNNSSTAKNEIIFAIAFDGKYTKTYGGTTFLTHAPVGGSMTPADFGINGGWAGIRTTSAFVSKFDGMTTDKRKQFYTAGQTLEITDVSAFANGYAIQKFKNVTSTGVPGSDPDGNFVDIDYPMFRLADAYLIYIECYLRGAGGSESIALDYFNALRKRAYGNTSGNIAAFPTATADKLQLVLDERARELHWEGHRRTDLIRFDQFTNGTYIWPWKGNVAGGIATQSFRNIFPIPQKAIVTNSNLIQNTGY
jgi:starch-binding outer membrane protein, SusD/RagB family